MGGYGKAVASAFAEDVSQHTEGCQHATVANNVMKALEEYMAIMDEFEDDKTTDEKRAQLIEQACQSPIWSEEMVNWCQQIMKSMMDMEYDEDVSDEDEYECSGCSDIMMKYMMEPLYPICGINERDKDKKFQQLLKPLEQVCGPESLYVKLISTL